MQYQCSINVKSNKEMTKKDLVKAVTHQNPSLSRQTVEEAIALFFSMITFYLAHHQRVELRGFGVFSVRKRSSHQAHNPQTGVAFMVPEKIVPFFKPSHALKEALKKDSKKSTQASKKDGFFSTIYRDLMGR